MKIAKDCPRKTASNNERSMRCAVPRSGGGAIGALMRIIAAILLMLSTCWATGGRAPGGDADAAMKRHDYKTALRLIRPL